MQSTLQCKNREEGAGGGRGEEKREGGERGKFCARKLRAAPEGRRETRVGVWAAVST